MFLRSGWNVVRNASLAQGGTSKKRRHLHFTFGYTQVAYLSCTQVYD